MRARAISERLTGNGHGGRTDYGTSLITLALIALSAAMWIRVIAPAHTFGFKVIVGVAMLCGYLGVLRRVRRSLNWLELAPRADFVPKSEVDGFVTLTSLLITAAGVSLVATHPPLVGLLIACNVVCGLIIVDASRRLRREETSVEGTTYNVVNLGVYAALRNLLLWQIRFLLLALAVTVVGLL